MYPKVQMNFGMAIIIIYIINDNLKINTILNHCILNKESIYVYKYVHIYIYKL